MKPPRFDYVRATSTEEAIEVLAEYGDDARVLAGGQSLVAMLNMRLVAPEVIVDISRVPELAAITRTEDAIEIGAAVTQAATQRFDGLAAHLPLVARALPFVGHCQTRARGTVCGSLAHADPSSELPLCLAALHGEVVLVEDDLCEVDVGGERIRAFRIAPCEVGDTVTLSIRPEALHGEVVLRSSRGTRNLPAEVFQQDVLTTACEPDEMIVAARFPLHAPGERCAFTEFGIRHGDFAIVAVAALSNTDRVRVAVGGCSDRPHVTEFPPLEGETLAERLNALAWSLPLDDDHHASARYRRDLVRILGRQTVEAAMACRG